MKYFKSFSETLKNLTPREFEEQALALFRWQANANPVYRRYISELGVVPSRVQSLESIPFLPISFFKDQDVYCGESTEAEKVFTSSGTTGQVASRHYVWSEAFYLRHAQSIFEHFYGSLSGYHILALLPAYLERQGSSLVSMVDYFIRETKSEHSGFYLYNHDALVQKLSELANKQDKKVLLWGVTFGLLDLVESAHRFPSLRNLLVMETGGMKGRRREMVREEVHAVLTQAFGVSQIHSEYGMTEMMSQAYSMGFGKYLLPDMVRILIRDPYDPFSYTGGKAGGINVIDLANVHSCAFIETQDIGRWDENGRLEVLGRFDSSELRGCNLMVN